MKTRLADIAKSHTPALGERSNFNAYRLVVVNKDTPTSKGVAFTQGQLALAQPDTFEMKGNQYLKVYSNRIETHVALSDSDVRIL